MIERWEISNFKPIDNICNVEFGSITALSGINSSGKSSIIQSILLISQTLTNQSKEKSIVLNGNLIGLGTFSELKNKDSKPTDPLSIGFNFDFNKSYLGEEKKFTSFLRKIDVKINCSFDFYQPDNESTINNAKEAQIELRSGIINIETTHPIFKKIEVKIEKIEKEKIEKEAISIAEVNISEGYSMSIIGYVKEIRTETEKIVKEELRIELNHFLPYRFYRLNDNLDKMLKEILNDKKSNYNGSVGMDERADLVIASYEISSSTINNLNKIKSKYSGVPDFVGKTIAELRFWLHFDVPLKTRKKQKFKQEIIDFVINSITENKTKNKILTQAVRFGFFEIIDFAIKLVIDYFSSMIRYIGPLRADPKYPQSFPSSNEPGDVGVSGEFAAFIYDLRKKQSVSWWDPDTSRITNGTLSEGVDFWANYLGIARRISTQEIGSNGFSWKVMIDDSKTERSLQSVGVGVSQVLPILVAGLLAPTKTLFLIEQPELHLHPKAQAKLGDFFVSLSETNKFCIIETHSDCLINQFRFRMMKKNNSKFIKIYFISRKGDNKFAIDEVKISQSGNIENWPEDFFDENIKQEDLITKESILIKNSRNTPK